LVDDIDLTAGVDAVNIADVGCAVRGDLTAGSGTQEGHEAGVAFAGGVHYTVRRQDS